MLERKVLDVVFINMLLALHVIKQPHVNWFVLIT